MHHIFGFNGKEDIGLAINYTRYPVEMQYINRKIRSKKKLAFNPGLSYYSANVCAKMRWAAIGQADPLYNFIYNRKWNFPVDTGEKNNR
jgi:hypothetical protein